MYAFTLITSALLFTAKISASAAPAAAAGSAASNSTAAGGSGSGPGMTTDLTLPADKKSGEVTFYTFWNSPAVSCNPSKCPDDGFCAAIPLAYMQPKGATKSGCGSCIKMVYEKKAAIIRVMDTCPECPNVNIDISDKLFEQLIGDKGKGRVKMEWAFVDCQTGAGVPGPPLAAGVQPTNIPVGNTGVPAAK